MKKRATSFIVVVMCLSIQHLKILELTQVVVVMKSLRTTALCG